MCVWDLDIKGTLYKEGIVDSINLLNDNSDISGLSSYGYFSYGPVKIYYDTFAHENYNESNNKKNKIFHAVETMTQIPLSNTKRINSGFGGFAIYKLKDVLNNKVRYGYKDQDGQVECEHVIFNRQLPHKFMLNYKMKYLILDNP